MLPVAGVSKGDWVGWRAQKEGGGPCHERFRFPGMRVTHASVHLFIRHAQSMAIPIPLTRIRCTDQGWPKESHLMEGPHTLSLIVCLLTFPDGATINFDGTGVLLPQQMLTLSDLFKSPGGSLRYAGGPPNIVADCGLLGRYKSSKGCEILTMGKGCHRLSYPSLHTV